MTDIAAASAAVGVHLSAQSAVCACVCVCVLLLSNLINVLIVTHTHTHTHTQTSRDHAPANGLCRSHKHSLIIHSFPRNSLSHVEIFTFTFALCRPPSVRLSSVTFVRPARLVEISGNVSTPFGTLAIR